MQCIAMVTIFHSAPALVSFKKTQDKFTKSVGEDIFTYYGKGSYSNQSIACDYSFLVFCCTIHFVSFSIPSRRPPMNNLDRKRGIRKGGCSIIKIFWPIELNDRWSKNICWPKMIVWSGATFILRWSCFMSTKVLRRVHLTKKTLGL